VELITENFNQKAANVQYVQMNCQHSLINGSKINILLPFFSYFKQKNIIAIHFW
jgi:hypothetical protein